MEKDYFEFLKNENEEDLYNLAKLAEDIYAQGYDLSIGNIARQFLECVVCNLCSESNIEEIKNEKTGFIMLKETIDILFDVRLSENKYQNFENKCHELRVWGNTCSHYDIKNNTVYKPENTKDYLQYMYYIATWYVSVIYKKPRIEDKYICPTKINWSEQIKELIKQKDEVLYQFTKEKTSFKKLQESYNTLKEDYDELCKSNDSVEELNYQFNKMRLELDNSLLNTENLKQEKQELIDKIKYYETKISNNEEKIIKLKNRNKDLLQKNKNLNKKLKESESKEDLKSIDVSAKNINKVIKIENDTIDKVSEDVLETIRIFSRKGIKYINHGTISQFLSGVYTNQIKVFSLSNFKNYYGKYKDSGIPNLSSILQNIAEQGIIKYPEGNIEYVEENDKFLTLLKNDYKTQISDNRIEITNTEFYEYINNHLSKILLDFTRTHTIEYLYNKYKKVFPIIIQKNIWTSDYYFIVEKIDNNIAYGKVYNSNKELKQISYSANEPYYYFYSGALSGYINQLDITEENRNEECTDEELKLYHYISITRKILDYTHSQTIKSLYDNYHNNIPVCVRKNSWTNEYYFLVEKIINNFAVGKIYNYGKFQRQAEYPIDSPQFVLYDNIETYPPA